MSLIGKSVGNYQIKAKLGEGGMGTVYLGEHPLIGKRVAVKVLLDELASKEDIVQRFFNEAKAVNDIGHSNIVDIVDFGKMKGDAGNDVVYFIMEFLDGESLAARLRRTGLSFNETMHVMAQACSALAASHKKGIVHRDLKPDNIFLCPRGSDKNFVKLLDFGIAKLTGDGGQSHKTRTGSVIGTPAYMSPEQCEGKGLIDHRSDVYSLGVVMYELLTGRVPFPGEGFGEILVAQLTKLPDPPSLLNPDIPTELEAIVMQALEKDRNRRFQTMDEFAAALVDPGAHLQSYVPLSAPAGQRLTGQGPTTAAAQRPTTLSGAAAEMGAALVRSKTPLIALVGVAVVVAVLGVGGLLATRGQSAKPGEAVVAPKPVEEAKVSAIVEENVSITVNSDPSGALVYRADTAKNESGITPLTFKVKRNSPSFDILVKLDNYRSTPRTVNTDRDQKLLVQLDKVEQPPMAPVVDNHAPPAPAEKIERHHHASSGRTEKRGAQKKTEGAGDDMILLQPKF